MRGFLIFAAVSFLLLFAFGYTPSRYHKQAECAEVSQSDVLDAGVLAASDQGSKEANDKSAKEYQDKRDFAVACSDLAAQWNVADITRRAFWVGMIGLGALVITLLYTRDAAISAAAAMIEAQKATRISQDGTEAALDSVEISRSQARPFLNISKAYVFVFRVGFPIEIKFEIQNYGTTPATLRGIKPYVVFIPEGKRHVVQRVRHSFSDIIPPTGERFLKGVSADNLTQEVFDSFLCNETEIKGVISLLFSDQYGVWRNYFFAGNVRRDGANQGDSLRYTLAEESQRPPIDDYFPEDVPDGHLTDL